MKRSTPVQFKWTTTEQHFPTLKLCLHRLLWVRLRHETLPIQSEPGSLPVVTPLNSTLSAPSKHMPHSHYSSGDIFLVNCSSSQRLAVVLSHSQRKLSHHSILSHNKPVCIPTTKLTGDSCIAMVAGRGPGQCENQSGSRDGLVWGTVRDLECVPICGTAAWTGRGQKGKIRECGAGGISGMLEDSCVEFSCCLLRNVTQEHQVTWWHVLCTCTCCTPPEPICCFINFIATSWYIYGYLDC